MRTLRRYPRAMPTAPPQLILDFLGWLAAGPRSYAEVMEDWRTSCPRLPVWEDAVDDGLVARRVLEGARVVVELTPKGRARLSGVGSMREDRHPGRLVRYP